MNKVTHFLSKYFKGDTTVWIVFFILCVFSVIEMYSASSTLAYKEAVRYTAPILRHSFFLLVGIVQAYVAHLLPYKYIRYLGYLGLVVSIPLLVYTLVKGVDANDAKRWTEIAGIRFQPSELAKLSLIIVIADFITRVQAHPNNEKKQFIRILILSAVTIGLILLENFSTAAILGLTIFAMMFIGKIHWKKLLFIVLGVFSLLLILYAMVKIVPKDKAPSILDRAYTWVSRVEDKTGEDDGNYYEINDENLQVQYGRMAIANGGFWGVFPGNSVQRDYLPHAYDDFIYAIIIEEMGLVGGIFVMFLYLVLLFRTGQIAKVSRKFYPAILVTGLGLVITLQATTNMLVGSGFGLVTGQPLPLISRGGTSILITCLYFGIILGVIREIKEYEKKKIQNENTTIETIEDEIVEMDEI